MIQNFWNGHNCALFTCGGSKSGKSWSLLGTAVNKGIIKFSGLIILNFHLTC